MKQYFLMAGIVAIAGAFHSCKKDNQAAAPAQKAAASSLISAAPSASKLPEKVSFNTDQGTVTMLKFADWQNFDAVAQYMQNQVDAYEAQFNDKHEGLSDDALNNAAEEEGFDKQQPLIDMENQFGFSNAYRKVQNALKEAWLNQEDLDMANNPSLKTMFYGAEQSLINDRQQVMVNDTIYQCNDTGYFFIASNYSGNLSLIQSGAFGSFEQPSQTMGLFDWLGNLLTGSNQDESIFGPGCTTWKKKGDYDPRIDGNKRIYYYTGIRSFSLYCKSLAGVESYEFKPSKNKWKGYKTRITVFMTAALRDLYCGDVGPTVTEWEEKKSDDLQAHETSWGGGEGGTAFRAKNGLSIYGNYTYYGLNQAAVLSW